jgi:predicted NUDIX family NTP pyrophosphohydrolase
VANRSEPTGRSRLAGRLSAGILLYRRTAAGLEVLLAHPGGPFFARKDAGAWTIPKGEPGPGEDRSPAGLLAVARRELEEETGHGAPGGPVIDLGAITQPGGKVVHGWALQGDLDPAAARSNTFEMEWPPRSGRQASFPEVDRVAWFDVGEAVQRIHPAQISLLQRLQAALADPPRRI